MAASALLRLMERVAMAGPRTAPRLAALSPAPLGVAAGRVALGVDGTGCAALSAGGETTGREAEGDAPPLGMIPLEQAESNHNGPVKRANARNAPGMGLFRIGFVNFPIAVAAFYIAYKGPDIMRFNSIGQ